MRRYDDDDDDGDDSKKTITLCITKMDKMDKQ
jgi:hypothetical protein